MLFVYVSCLHVTRREEVNGFQTPAAHKEGFRLTPESTVMGEYTIYRFL